MEGEKGVVKGEWWGFGDLTKKRPVMENNKQLLLSFFESYWESNKFKNILVVKFSEFDLFPKDSSRYDYIDKMEQLSSDKQYDCIIGDLPFGLYKVESELGLKINKNWEMLYQSLKKLSPNGEGFFLLEPTMISSESGKAFISILRDVGYEYDTVLNVPEKVYSPLTNIRPILIRFSKSKYNKLFIAEITPGSLTDLIDNLNKRANTGMMEKGLLVEYSAFSSFNKFSMQNQIAKLSTQYKSYKRYNISDVAISINQTKTYFTDKPNSIYIPKLGNSPVQSSLEELKIKHHNYFQIELDESIVLSRYLTLYFESELGKLVLSSLNTGSVIPNVNKSEIANCPVAIPSIDEQKLLSHAYNKLDELKKTVHELQRELSLNPKSVNAVLEKFDSIQYPLKMLSQEDEILSMIRKGEGLNIEFKQTFSKNIHTNNKDKEIEKSSLKNIVGFLNAKGGTLLIGVNDNGEVTGIENDFFKSNDEYLLNFKNALNTKIGTEFYPLLEYDIITVLERKVLRVNCKPSEVPCFYDETEFFVRTNPATDKLEGKKQLDYIKMRFKQ